MRQLWCYQDYVDHLGHSNNLVRRWAFETIEKRFPYRCTTEVARLIGDSDEHLACAAPKYLARHQAIDYAPAILESFLRDEGNVPGNCAIALGDMHYEPAVDAIFDCIPHCESENTLFGIVSYLGKIRREDCHQALRDIFAQLSDDYLGGAAAHHLLDHGNPQDVPLVFGTYIDTVDSDVSVDMFLDGMMRSAGAGGLYGDLTDIAQDLLESPKKVLKEVLRQYPLITPADSETTNEIVGLIKGSGYQHIATSLMFKAQSVFRSRFPEGHPPDHLTGIFELDSLCLAFLEEFSKRSSCWKQAINNKDMCRNLVSAVLACYFSIQERGGYLRALDPEAACEDLINVLKDVGSDFPELILNRLIELSPIKELKATLTEELLTWGDIWIVRLMGRIGDDAFVPDLVRVVRESDSLSYIREDAIRALNGMDESAHKSLLSVIQDGELTDAWDVFVLLEHLPYPESFDIAVKLWEDGDMDSSEIYAACLENIGDSRGIEALQEIFFEGNAAFVGDSLEVLSLLYNKDIPELRTIHQERKARLKRQEQRRKELAELAAQVKKRGSNENSPQKGTVKTVRRKAPKVGRNAPCPCGSGKKYKKCCLNKDQNAG